MTVTAETVTTDVLIAGAGPVGLTLANFLGKYGVTAIVVEQLPSLIDYPRGVGLDDESFRTIQSIGLAEEVLPFTVPQHVMRLVNGHGDVILTNDPKGEPYGWTRKHGFLQPEVDNALYEGLSRYPGVEVRFGHSLVDIAEGTDTVTATVEHALADGGTETVTIDAKYLVGCDGGKSPTRKWMGVRFEGKSPSTRWVVIDVNNDPLGTPNVYLGADPARPYVSIGLPHAVRRWEFMLFDDEPSEKVEDDAFVAELLKDHVPDSTQLDVIRRRVFTHHGRIASSFRKGRVLIAGDAAHLMPVWMGQGWNSGVRDATNLGWKLASVIKGQTDEAILDTYTTERTDHAKAMIDLSMTFGSIIKPTDRTLAFLRDTAASAMNVLPQVKEYFTDMRFKPIPRYSSGVVVDQKTLRPGTAEARVGGGRFIPFRNTVEKTSPVGLQFIQPRVITADRTNVRLDDVLGDWWTIAAWGNDPTRLLGAEDVALFRRLGGSFVTFISETQRPWAEEQFGATSIVVGDTTNALKSWFDVRSVGAVAIRPDHFVAVACLAQDLPKAFHAALTAAHAVRTFAGPETTAAAHETAGV
ncbi:bifunctional 3-(3-hydroxy-phenyl)propionate/3-hydroxycinnamic acid hydroxylase [Raineyella sp. W15-4]|uniref:bifunctional 3-(3-hydroxy-phenyl)propionate/3-hydroxycinnamic acid hydroxylase MhpA n=1 Tax=Raineyella sp. W15-4 TaxID=3081651 RepID=UPI002954E265|nr:bifunctional 3-(3-hydroxy-phenyl)propionate/3-hydroxycinnamic acid hydroxylase [Raineyella sp. W15-4]WOQ17813.1 bifunctional 3-(3-hydroxy-phenyl)propionate/3-hydroxycinnamic acid hydroxylase [Raineyella sp. W15-4]